jgi:PAS domain S-box-containing protein
MERRMDFEGLLATVPAVFFRGYADWTVDFFDEKIRDLTGYAAEEFLSRRLRWSQLILEEDLPRVKGTLREALQSGGLYVREYRIRSRSGAVHWVQERGKVQVSETGRLQSVTGFFFDITDYKELQLELARSHEALQRINQDLEAEVRRRTQQFVRSERRFRLIFETSRDWIILADSDFRVVTANPGAVSALSVTDRSEPAGRPLESLFASRAVYLDWRRRILREGCVVDWETQFLRDDGSPVDVVVTSDLLRDDEGVFEGVVLVAKELVEWRRLMEHHLHLQKMADIGRMAAGIAHEINTPLMVILAHAQLLQDDVEPESEVFQSLKTIEAQTHICRRIVRDLLDFSRQEPTAHGIFDIREVLGDVIRVVDHSFLLDRVVLIYEPAPDPLPLRGDPEKLRRILLNLLENARQAIGSGGAVLVRCQTGLGCPEVLLR